MIFFILGLLLGLGVAWWNNHRLKSQLGKILTIAPDTPDLLPSLSITSVIRREIFYLQQKYDEQTQELHCQQDLLAYCPLAFLRIDDQNQLLWCNKQAQTLLQIDRWQPDQLRLVLHLVRSYELDQLIEFTRQTQTSQVKEWAFYPNPSVSQGSSESPHVPQRSIALKAYSLPLPQGQIGVFIENQQPLRELSRSRDRAFSDLTHELRTPLTSISLVAETLQNRLQNPERRWAQQLLKETKRLSNLVEDWLDLSQLAENAHQTLTYELLDLQILIRSAWEILEPIAEGKQVTLDYQGIEQISFSGDRSRLIQVFLNLLDNSLKHSPPQKEILVMATEQELKIITIDIIDHGSGFSDEDLPYVFDRLYRGDLSRTRQGFSEQSPRQGSGLGLAITQEIIIAHGGSIVARNHPSTGGAWIQVILPINQG
ncbi:sensor histidine kinase [Aphanothece sacrum]|uniref:histidine kinase n=1 Tax=Aphanothece sacrum FPU1 TaxID=1920663 RepID=A0A401IEA2_APHSA|nr:ATP-binding protein [Aphanothece sacrum]GBF79605.1 two-component sensor histidine kinase [Aphanothece sacrum FPU1]GBF87065.1 two-component sensor histidine kinase [Aphanothece sacrum FPU3]